MPCYSDWINEWAAHTADLLLFLVYYQAELSFGVWRVYASQLHRISSSRSCEMPSKLCEFTQTQTHPFVQVSFTLSLTHFLACFGSICNAWLWKMAYPKWIHFFRIFKCVSKKNDSSEEIWRDMAHVKVWTTCLCNVAPMKSTDVMIRVGCAIPCPNAIEILSQNRP